MKKWFSNLMDKDGFYIILFICVCLIATTAVWVSKNNSVKTKDENISKINEDFFKVEKGDEEEPSLEISKMGKTDDEEEKNDEEEQNQDIEKEEEKQNQDQDIEEIMEDETDKGKEDDETEKLFKESEPIESNTNSPVIQNNMLLPLVGTLGVDFTGEGLVYSETLDEWVSHQGIDLYAKEGTIVRASLDGVVKDVYDDDLWGITITIDHGNGIETRYKNLSTEKMVKIGQKVKKGDPISGIGRTAKLELAEEPHLHFEVLKEGICVDPKDYLPNIQ